MLIVSLAGCSEVSTAGGKPVAIEPAVKVNISREYIDRSTYWCLPQYFGRVPKYCAYGTYTHKHIPLAFKANGEIFHVYTDNTKDENFYVYAAKGNSEKVLVHTIEDWEDPHTNAVIHVLDSGIVHVHVSARGIDGGFQSGKILASKTPYELDFVCIDGCDNDNFEGYPQVWSTSWGEHVTYSLNMFDYELHPKQWMRSPHYRVGDKRQQLVRGGHYFISFYDGETMYVVYNLLVDGHPDNRVNLYLMKTSNGIDWVTYDGKPLSLPLEPDSKETLIYKSEGYTYLKDLDVDDGLKILFTESSDFDPTIGSMFTKEWSNSELKTISQVNHNYNAGAYIGDNIVLTQDGSDWIGGDIVVYNDYKEVARDTSDNCAYVRKVINSGNMGVVSCDHFHLNESASHYMLTLD